MKRFCKKKCIYHSLHQNSTDLVSPKDEESWKTLLRAAEIRNLKKIRRNFKSLGEEVVRSFIPSKVSKYFDNEKVVK